MIKDPKGLPRLVRPSAPEQVTEILREAIILGRFRPGQRLQQAELAESLGVSRMPIREALRRLEAEGLVVLHPHRGAQVAGLSAHELQEIYDIRIALETMALRCAVPRFTPSDLNRLESILKRAETLQDPEAWLASNLQFHRGLYTPSDRRHLCGLIENLRARSELYLRIMATKVERLHQAHQEHWDILQSCRRRDVVAAVGHLETHLRNTVRSLLEGSSQSKRP